MWVVEIKTPHSLTSSNLSDVLSNFWSWREVVYVLLGVEKNFRMMNGGRATKFLMTLHKADVFGGYCQLSNYLVMD